MYVYMYAYYIPVCVSSACLGCTCVFMKCSWTFGCLTGHETCSYVRVHIHLLQYTPIHTCMQQLDTTKTHTHTHTHTHKMEPCVRERMNEDTWLQEHLHVCTTNSDACFLLSLYTQVYAHTFQEQMYGQNSKWKAPLTTSRMQICSKRQNPDLTHVYHAHTRVHVNAPTAAWTFVGVVSSSPTWCIQAWATAMDACKIRLLCVCVCKAVSVSYECVRGQRTECVYILTYIHTYIYVCMYVCIYIYLYMRAKQWVWAMDVSEINLLCVCMCV